MSQVKPIDIDVVPVGFQFNRMVAVHVLGWTYKDLRWHTAKGIKTEMRRFSESLDWSDIVEAEIERRGLVDRYIHWLLEEVSPISKRRQRSYDLVTIEAFAMVHATPEQRCRAALGAVRDG